MIPDDLDPLESMLRGLPLRQPSEALDERLARTWDRRARRRKRLAAGLVAAASLAVAASLVLALLIRFSGRGPVGPGKPENGPVVRTPSIPSVPPQVASRPLEPSTRIEQVWCVVTGSKVETTGDGPPLLSEQCQVTRQVHYVADGGRVHVDWTIPGEETIAIPMDYN